MRSAHRERAPAARENEDQDAAKGNRDSNFIVAPRHAMGQSTCSAFETGFSNCSIDFLDRETARIDALIARTEKAIELAQERRSALISAAVTGKIDVRETNMEAA